MPCTEWRVHRTAPHCVPRRSSNWIGFWFTMDLNRIDLPTQYLSKYGGATRPPLCSSLGMDPIWPSCPTFAAPLHRELHFESFLCASCLVLSSALIARAPSPRPPCLAAGPSPALPQPPVRINISPISVALPAHRAITDRDHTGTAAAPASRRGSEQGSEQGTIITIFAKYRTSCKVYNTLYNTLAYILNVVVAIKLDNPESVANVGGLTNPHVSPGTPRTHPEQIQKAKSRRRAQINKTPPNRHRIDVILSPIMTYESRGCFQSGVSASSRLTFVACLGKPVFWADSAQLELQLIGL
ncbi:hypothetical protein CHU98_g2015 [Xylaria longipes]|nr:hypothetical protein CHU98_g2015 [Xylaria longipes]